MITCSELAMRGEAPPEAYVFGSISATSANSAKIPTSSENAHGGRIPPPRGRRAALSPRTKTRSPKVVQAQPHIED